MNISKETIEAAVRKALQAIPSNFPFQRESISGGVTLIKTPTVKPQPFDVGGQKIPNVYVTDVLTLEESPRLGLAVMEMHDKAEFPWTLKYDEVDYIISGQLEIEINGQKVAGLAGDMIYIPKDSSIKFRAKDNARFVCVMYPANWMDL